MKIKTLKFDEDFKNNNSTDTVCCFVFACGYESRSLYLLKKIHSINTKLNINYCGFTFPHYQQEGSRVSNYKYLKQQEINVNEVSATDPKTCLLYTSPSPRDRG